MADAHTALAEGWSLTEETGVELAALGDGHINDTLQVTTSAGPRFVLQRINNQVFKDPGLVMGNLERIRALVDSHQPGFIPTLRPCIDGSSAWVSGDGHWWRLWQFVEGTRSLSSTRDPDLARSAGRAFGCFQRLLERLDEPPLAPTISGFLELGGYLDGYDRAVNDAVNDAVNEAGLPADVVALTEAGAFIDSHRRLAERLPGGDCYIHGDCKMNNLLFEANTAEVSCVLDLDTVMRGHWAWDIGDLSRSLLMSGGDLVELFTAVVAGFAQGRQRELSVRELVDAPIYMAFTLGLRFLTDHLSGDCYFKVRQHGDNLLRAAEQFALVRQLESDRVRLEAAAAAGLRLAELGTDRSEVDEKS